MRFIDSIPALLISIFVILIAFVIFIFNLSTISVPEDQLEYDVIGIKHPVNIYKNSYGISHIVAKTNEDLYFSMGYTQAFDRMWQMDYTRRAAAGRLSEVLGTRTIEFDKFMRSLELEETARNIWNSMDLESRNILMAYSDGVNAFIKTRKNKLPLEFGALDYIPEKWHPTDCLMIARAMAFELSMSFWIDITMGEIAEKLSLEKALELLPDYPANAPYVCDQKVFVPAKKVIPDMDIEMFYPDSTSPSPVSDNNHVDSSLISFYRNYIEKYKDVRKYLQCDASAIGSNCWAINIEKKDQNIAIIANDPHLRLGLPAKWMQLHITSPSYNAVGFSIPGIPFIISGRNDFIGWGITNIMADGCDFFIEKLDSSGTAYFNGKEYKKFNIKIDTIEISGQEEKFYYTRSTERSRVISDFHLLKDSELLLDTALNTENDFLNNYVITYNWVGNRVSNEIKAIAKINKAKDWNEFLSACNGWCQPALNFTYADRDGNIGIAPSGMIPRRQKNCQPNIPNPGWMEDYDWEGYLMPADLPKLYNPEKNYVLSANNSLKADYPEFITNFWEPHSRAERIEEMLKESDVYYSSRDAQNMQLDVLSPYARDLLELTVPALIEFESLLYGQEKIAYEKIKTWDYILSADSEISTIFIEFFNQLIYNTFADELGDRLFVQYTFISSLPTRKLLELMSEPASPWFDNINTPEFERRDYIIIRSFKNAVDKLSDMFNEKPMASWKYGILHTLTLEHVFSNGTFLEPTVTVGPLEMGGNNTTINNTEYHLYDPYKVVLGASMRFIADMSDTLVYTAIPGGASGDPLSPNYSDQARLWLNGGYLKLSTSKSPSSDFKVAIRLIPD